jgi:hypothetical protein
MIVTMILPDMDAGCMLLRPHVAIFPQKTTVITAERIRLTMMLAS